MMFRHKNSIHVGWGTQGVASTLRPDDDASKDPEAAGAVVRAALLRIGLSADKAERAAERAKAHARSRNRGLVPAGPSGTGARLRRFKGSADDLDRLVWERIQALLPNRGTSVGFSAEEIAVALDIRVDQVKHSLHRLNLAGKVSQAERCFAHDTTRAGLFCGPASGWGANIYRVRDSAFAVHA